MYLFVHICYVGHTPLEMATFFKLLSVLLVLSIFGDIIHIKDVWSDGGKENGNSLGLLKYSLVLPGAECAWGRLAGALTKSAIKAAKKRAKQEAKKKGNARNKQKQKGMSIFQTELFIINI